MAVIWLKKNKKKFNKFSFQHPFHVLSLSYLPMFIAFFVGGSAILLVANLHSGLKVCSHEYIVAFLTYDLFKTVLLSNDYVNSSLGFTFLLMLSFILIAIWAWSRELVNESTFQGLHTKNVQQGLIYGMFLFLASEAMLFFPFFWSFFHTSFAPTIAIGAVWPPVGIRDLETLNPYMLPLVNTVVLLTSGISLVSAHRAILGGSFQVLRNSLFITILLGILFSWLQFLEYGLTKYTINDGTFGSTFFMLTGLHGFHVIVGTCLLLVAYLRTVFKHFSKHHHILFECAAWYWHFVDVVWLFVFVFVYVWGVSL